ncbi:hypothetical protein IGI96_003536 [Enterococcus sp. DIV0421]|uniref:ROK family protein n=1 Tax=Enterococcus sp. DIV0421 TaxID=2774688 RepID=UPI003F262D3C
MEYYLAVDIGGTAIKYGLIDNEGIFFERHEIDTEAHLGGEAILDKIYQLVKKYINVIEIKGIAISSAGMIDPVKGEILYSGPQIPNYAGIQFKSLLEEKFHIPCEIENDVNCAGLAESISGASKGSKLSFCLTIGTGIGGCLIQNNKIFHGSSYSACEVGYIPLPGGAFQDIASTTALVKLVTELTGDKSSEWNGHRIFLEAKEGNALCRSAISKIVENLTVGIASICYIVNPEIVVLGGGIMAQEDYLRPEIEISLKNLLVSNIAEKTKIAFAHHKNDAGMLGAYYHFRSKH